MEGLLSTGPTQYSLINLLDFGKLFLVKFPDYIICTSILGVKLFSYNASVGIIFRIVRLNLLLVIIISMIHDTPL